jgi:methyltransferase-like protein
MESTYKLPEIIYKPIELLNDHELDIYICNLCETISPNSIISKELKQLELKYMCEYLSYHYKNALYISNDIQITYCENKSQSNYKKYIEYEIIKSNLLGRLYNVMNEMIRRGYHTIYDLYHDIFVGHIWFKQYKQLQSF